jgi:hypothetical protein
MNYQEEYYKYKKMYLNLKNLQKIKQTGGMFKIEKPTPESISDFVVESVLNGGIPRDGEPLSSQCMFISISDFFKKRGQRVTVADLRLVGGIGPRSTHDEFDEIWPHSVRALYNISKYYGIRISIYASLNGEQINPLMPNLTRTHIIPNTTYAAGLLIPGSEHMEAVEAEIALAHGPNAVHIIHKPGHFQLITKVTNDGKVVYDLDTILAPVLQTEAKFGAPPVAKSAAVLNAERSDPSYLNDYSPPPRASVGQDLQRSMIWKDIKLGSTVTGIPSAGTLQGQTTPTSSVQGPVLGQGSGQGSGSVVVSQVSIDSIKSDLKRQIEELESALRATLSSKEQDITSSIGIHISLIDAIKNNINTYIGKIPQDTKQTEIILLNGLFANFDELSKSSKKINEFFEQFKILIQNAKTQGKSLSEESISQAKIQFSIKYRAFIKDKCLKIIELPSSTTTSVSVSASATVQVPPPNVSTEMTFVQQLRTI